MLLPSVFRERGDLRLTKALGYLKLKDTPVDVFVHLGIEKFYLLDIPKRRFRLGFNGDDFDRQTQLFINPKKF